MASKLLVGTRANDMLIGGPSWDILWGKSGADTLIGSSGDDLIVGGQGIDLAVYSGTFKQYKISYVSGWGSFLSVNGPDGRDYLQSVELLQFSDGLYNTITRVFQPNHISVVSNGIVSEGDDIVYTFTRGGNLSSPLDIYYSIDTSGGITNDDIKGLFGSKIHFDVGSAIVTLTYSTIEDWRNEGTEALTLTAYPGSSAPVSASSTVVEKSGSHNLYFDAWTPDLEFSLYKMNSASQVSFVANIEAEEKVALGHYLYFHAVTRLPGESPHSDLYRLGIGDVIEKLDNSFNLSQFRSLTVFQDTLYFIGESSSAGKQLYRLDSANHITQITTVEVGPSNELKIFNGRLYFESYNAHSFGTNLSSVGSNGDIEISSNLLDPYNLAVFQDKLYFNGGQTSLMHALDSAGNVSDIVGSPIGSLHSTIFNNELYFRGYSATLGSELYKIGNNGAASLVSDLAPGQIGSEPSDLFAFGDSLYFKAFTSSTGSELFKVTKSGQVQLAHEFSSGAADGDPTGLTYFNGAMYLRATEQGSSELYRLDFDGTHHLVTDHVPGGPSAGGYTPIDLVVL